MNEPPSCKRDWKYPVFSVMSLSQVETMVFLLSIYIPPLYPCWFSWKKSCSLDIWPLYMLIVESQFCFLKHKPSYANHISTVYQTEFYQSYIYVCTYRDTPCIYIYICIHTFISTLDILTIYRLGTHPPGFELYDTDMQTVLADITFRNYDQPNDVAIQVSGQQKSTRGIWL